MANCLNCDKEIIQKEGKRERKFCDNKNKCKMEFHNKSKKKEPKYVQFKTFKELQERFDKLTEAAKNTPLGKQITDDIKKNPIPFTANNIELPKHKLWQEGDPVEGSNAFYLRKGVRTYAELENEGK